MVHPLGLTAFLGVATFAVVACSKSTPTSMADGGVGGAVDGGIGAAVDGGVIDAGTLATSTCEAPQFCNEAETCLRVRTAEGDARCGQMPPCETRLCTTSADCAALGAGYFCDTPMSGCCLDAQLPRCLPPCGFHDGWPPGLAELVNELDTFERGGQADLDRDGRYETTTTIGDGGVRTIVVTGPGEGVMLTVVVADADHATAQGDFNEDSRIDFTESEVRTNNRVDYSGEWDTDFDGTMDRRVVRSVDLVARTFTRTVYRLADGGFQQESTRSGPAWENQGQACKGLDGFPSDVGGVSRSPLGRTNIRIIENGTPGACTSDQAGSLEGAFRKILSDSLKCLERINPLLKAKLSNALANKKLNVACGNTCPGIGATADLDGHWLKYFEGERVNVNFSAARDATDLQAMLLHELLHFAGNDHVGGADGQGGTDPIYSCGRHCGGCSNWGLGARDSPQTPWSKELDCARCAAPGFKGLCGTQTAYVDKCDTARALCHAGAAFANCEKCLMSEEEYCDGTPIPDSVANRFVCCQREGCPTDWAIDQQCVAQMEGVVTPCPPLPADVCPP